MEQISNEKIIIESQNSYIGIVKKIMTITFILAIVSFILGFVFQNIGDNNWQKGNNISKKSFTYFEEGTEDYKEYKKYMSNADTFYTIGSIGTGVGVISGVVAIVSISLFFYTRKMKIVVTDKRVYGQTAFGKQVDLPFDSVSAIGKSVLKGIAVATSSGRIRFLLISNRDNIYKSISNLLIQRQEVKQEQKEVINVSNSNADELKKYKELLDSGVITQEEFNAKKRQLLGL